MVSFRCQIASFVVDMRNIEIMSLKDLKRFLERKNNSKFKDTILTMKKGIEVCKFPKFFIRVN